MDQEFRALCVCLCVRPTARRHRNDPVHVSLIARAGHRTLRVGVKPTGDCVSVQRGRTESL
jgi:hypothetical protein